ncbi:eCIS core domain-containing protein [Pinibacter aurantiacus]|uniref:DUF4157 domain-containing protein n=1 Tax=Pinibacter aurantiacus TaxID=2851599 RepID=A0A9E2SCF6_9BACT|nr:DUF4157 domain-containing protein [Pinibacter aurantiacus]MBV4360533.1 DUF4157 domain-containing protein [Pinibacter aurantiacus]
MKSTYSRRYRRSTSATKEQQMFKKDHLQEQTFFGAPVHDNFFKPNLAIQRKCAHCEQEEKNVKRMADEKKEEKIQKQEDKKEENVQRQAEHKEEEKVQKAAEHKEEEKVQKSEEKKEEDKTVAKKEAGTASGNLASTNTYIHSLEGKGQKMPDHALHFFGEKMGRDFSDVRIHTDMEAELSAKNINAKAFATGNNIVFGKGHYNPESAEGKRLLAHELTHVIQQQDKDTNVLKRVTDNTEKEKETDMPSIVITGQAANSKNKTSFGCAGVNVQGQTDANYTDSFSATGTPKASTKCETCEPPDCITVSGVVVSVFKANPVISLPNVPDGLSDCESRAVGRFINTTLKRHEQQHVAAFNTYNGVIRTPYKFTGCRSELDSYVQAIHDDINTKRMDASNARSNALDPFNATIPCDCDE